MSRNFREMIEARWARGNFVCVGLDSEYSRLPESMRRPTIGGVGGAVWQFNCDIVDATKEFVVAYKPNIAFYEGAGVEGIEALRNTIKHIRVAAPGVPVILDAKRADIGNTNRGYVEMAFTYLGVDAITVHPYLGAEALEPFLKQADKGVIVLCKTSNPGAGEFQDLPVTLAWSPSGRTTVPLYQCVAAKVAQNWNQNGNCGLVVGAPYPDQLRAVRQLVGDMPLLIPGVGFQQKDVPLEQQVKQVVSAGKDSRGWGMIINSSRGIIFASSGKDFAEAAHRETAKLHHLINQYLTPPSSERVEEGI